MTVHGLFTVACSFVFVTHLTAFMCLCVISSKVNVDLYSA